MGALSFGCICTRDWGIFSTSQPTTPSCSICCKSGGFPSKQIGHVLRQEDDANSGGEGGMQCWGALRPSRHRSTTQIRSRVRRGYLHGYKTTSNEPSPHLQCQNTESRPPALPHVQTRWSRRVRAGAQEMGIIHRLSLAGFRGGDGVFLLQFPSDTPNTVLKVTRQTACTEVDTVDGTHIS
jgi:hypothetical protein